MNRLAQLCTDNLLVSVALCYIAGASCAFWLDRALAELPVIAIGSVLLVFCMLLAVVIRNRMRPLTTLPFFVLAGLLHTQVALQPIADPHHIAALISQPVKTTLVGRIVAMAENNGERTRFELACEALLFHDPNRQATFQPVRGTVLLSIQGGIDPQFVPGTKIMVIAMVDRIRNYQTPGAFDYRLQMATKSIFCSGWIQSQREILLVADPWESNWQAWSYGPERMRQKTADFLIRQFPTDIAGLYQALLIGSVVNVSANIMETFKENGCFHILSISGLHFSLLGFFCVGVFTFLLKRSTWLLLHTHVPTVALVVTAPVLLLYTFIAGFNIPAIRSLLTALLVLYAVLLRRQQTLIHLIAAAALIVQAFNPLALFTPSFQLSFAAVLAINLIYPRLPLFVSNAPARPHDTALWMQALRFVQSMLYVSLAATAGTLPFLLYHFNRVSLIGPAMNLLIEPLLCLWALPCGLLAVPLISFAPDVAMVLLQAGQPGIALTLWLAEAVAGFPYASIWTATPHPAEIIAYYLILILCLLPRPTIARGAVASGLTLLLFGSFTYPLWFAPKNRELTISFLDVGQGAATLIQLPNGTDLLIDGGGYQSEQFDPGQNLIAPFLWRKRIWRLHDLIITHPHQDHYNGLPFIAERFHPRRLIVNGETGEDPSYARLIQLAERSGAVLHTAEAGELVHQGDDFTFTCLGMNGLQSNDAPLTTNDRSLVFLLQSGAYNFLFPADIGLVSENLLIQNRATLSADVLLAPHHGSHSSTSRTFLDAVDPKLIVVSASHKRQGILPDPEHLRVWGQKKIPVLTTGQDGTVSCFSAGKTLRANSFSGVTYHFER